MPAGNLPERAGQAAGRFFIYGKNAGFSVKEKPSGGGTRRKEKVCLPKAAARRYSKADRPAPKD